jgi:hypothetical protein
VDPFQFTFGFGHLSDMAGISNLLHIYDIDRSLYGPGETNNVKKSHIKRKFLRLRNSPTVSSGSRRGGGAVAGNVQQWLQNFYQGWRK